MANIETKIGEREIGQIIRDRSPCGLPVVHYSLRNPQSQAVNIAFSSYSKIIAGFFPEMLRDRFSTMSKPDNFIRYLFTENKGFVTILSYHEDPVASCEIRYGTDETGQDCWAFGIEVASEMQGKHTGCGYNVLAASVNHLRKIDPNTFVIGTIHGSNERMMAFARSIHRDVAGCTFQHLRSADTGNHGDGATWILSIPVTTTRKLNKFAKSKYTLGCN